MSFHSNRIFLGCIAGALAVIACHQTTLQIFFWLGLAPQAAFRVALVPPFNAPLVVSITFWGGLYGAIFGWLMPRMRGPLWLNGMAAGVFAMLLGWFVFLPLMGHPAAFGGSPGPMARSFTAYQMWGLGMAFILPALLPRPIASRQRGWAQGSAETG